MTGTQSRVYSVTGVCRQGWTISHLVSAVDVFRAIDKALTLDKELIRVTRAMPAQPIHS